MGGDGDAASPLEIHASTPAQERVGRRFSFLSHALFYGALAVVLVADQLTKRWIVLNLQPYQPTDLVEWLAPILSLTFVRNTGVAFGLFQGLGLLFTLLAFLVVVAILAFRRTLPSSDVWLHAALGLVTGGALGNVIDRVLRGYVVDFLDVNFRPLHNWPVFNLADSAIVVGVALLLLDSLLVQGEGVDDDV